MFRRLASLFFLLSLFLVAPGPVTAFVEDISRFDRITYGDEVPTEACTPGKAIHLLLPEGNLFTCDSSALLVNSSSTSGVGTIVGIASGQAGVDSIRYNTITLTNICGPLGTVSHVNVIAGPSGVECVLRDSSLIDTPGFYSIVIMDDNPVTLSPFGTQLLNGENVPMAPVRGPLARIHVERRSDGEWYADVISKAGYGEPLASVCAVVVSGGGGTNVSSSGSGSWYSHTFNCLIPAGAITTGTIMDVCVGVRVLSGSAPPTLTTRLVANSTVIWQGAAEATIAANLPGNTRRHCIGLMGGGPPPPTAASAIHTSATHSIGATQWDIVSSTIGDPVTVDNSVDVVLAFESLWATAGTGTNSLQELYLDVRGARFAN